MRYYLKTNSVIGDTNIIWTKMQYKNDEFPTYRLVKDCYRRALPPAIGRIFSISFRIEMKKIEN